MRLTEDELTDLLSDDERRDQIKERLDLIAEIDWMYYQDELRAKDESAVEDDLPF